jgi:predicted transposase/invertase (TIGR01784 family)
VYKEEGRIEGHKEGHKEGHMKGRKEAHVEDAINMLHDGVSVEKISQYTHLPREEIEALL